jgi:hypothetical protein
MTQGKNLKTIVMRAATSEGNVWRVVMTSNRMAGTVHK